VHSALLLVIVVAAAAFDFTNGFHDTANVVASSISTRALAPRTAITLVSVLNFAGAFISLKVAATIATGIIDAGLVIAFIYRVFGRRSPGPVTRGFRVGQIVSNSAPALAHGTNDAQKTMGVITLALVAHGSLSPHHASVPAWVVILSATAISLRTYAGGWRIIRTVGSRIIRMDSAQAFSAQASGAAVIPRLLAPGIPTLLDPRHLRRGHGGRGGHAGVGGALGRGWHDRRRVGDHAADGRPVRGRRLRRGLRLRPRRARPAAHRGGRAAVDDARDPASSWTRPRPPRERLTGGLGPD
jgi:hypothetical protein